MVLERKNLANSKSLILDEQQLVADSGLMVGLGWQPFVVHLSNQQLVGKTMQDAISVISSLPTFCPDRSTIWRIHFARLPLS